MPGRKPDEGTPPAAVTQRHIIERPRLLKLLDETSARIILLIAPAGYGKTTLARQWTATRVHAMYSCDLASRDVAGVAAALARVAEQLTGRPTGVLDYLRHEFRVGDEPVLTEVVREALAACPANALLVIDDYHIAQSSATSSQLMASVAESFPGRILIGSRVRPSWVSPRKLLYGEVAEVAAHELSMTSDETRLVFERRGASVADDLVATIGGWPAAVALASAADAKSIPTNLPTDVHNFLATEVFAAFAPSTQAGLTMLAIAPTVSSHLVEALLGGQRDTVVAEAAASGFLTPLGGERFVIHPLLRQFLRDRLEAGSRGKRGIARTCKILIAASEWDDAFAVITHNNANRFLRILVGRGLFDLLQEGRVNTLAVWIRALRSIDPTAPEADLAEAELEFRTGAFSKSSELALRAATAQALPARLRSRAYFRSGQSAFFEERIEVARQLYERARDAALDPEDLRLALWGQVTDATYTGDPHVMELIDAFERAAEPTPESRVRAATARLTWSWGYAGRLEQAIADAQRYHAYLDHVPDLMVRSSFLTAMVSCLAMNARYAAGLGLLQDLRDNATRGRLSFALRHAELRRAIVLLGLRRFSEAAGVLDRLERVTRASDDAFLLASVAAVRARVAASQHRRIPGHVLDAQVAGLHDSLQGEYFASRSLYAASTGELATAKSWCAKAAEKCCGVESELLTLTAEAIIAGLANSRVDDPVARLVSVTSTTAAYDAIVCGYRIWPPLLSHLVASGIDHQVLSRVVRDSRDTHLASGILDAPVVEPTWGDAALTSREREVLDLVAEGLTNGEIASRLFISKSTAKVHVRHIFEKLGVRSRTEAALRLRAARDEDDSGDSADRH